MAWRSGNASPRAADDPGVKRDSEPAEPLAEKSYWVPLTGSVILGYLAWPAIPMADTGWRYLVASLAGVMVGACWQVLGRRDLADRLLWPAVLIVPASLLFLVRSGDYRPAMAQALLGVVAGLVLAEQLLRLRDRRLSAREERTARPSQAGDQAS
jgi:hypothetical protein